MKNKNKYAELLKRKRGKFTADNRPIETYSRGKEKIYVAFDEHNNMEIIGHNPIPLLALGAGMLAKKALPSIARGASSLLSRKKKQPEETFSRQPTLKPKSITDNIIEREVYGDNNFNIYE